MESKKRGKMKANNLVPLFLQTSSFSQVRDLLAYQGCSKLSYISRLTDLVTAPFSLLFFDPTSALNHVQTAWIGYKDQLQSFDSSEIQQCRLLEKSDLQKEFILQSNHWKTVLQTCPETFEFAPASVKNTRAFVILAVQGNPAMIQFADQKFLTDIQFLKHLAVTCPRIVLFLKKPLQDSIIEDWSPEQKTRMIPDQYTHLSQLDREQIDYLIHSCRDIWQSFLDSSNSRFLYLKRRDIGSPHTIQMFKDGKTWVHIYNRYIGYGSLKKVKPIYDWDTGKRYAKLSVDRNGFISHSGSDEERLKSEITTFNLLKGCRGIVQILDIFTIPTKNPNSPNKEKKVLIQERYDASMQDISDCLVKNSSMQNISDSIVKKWTLQDLSKLTLDLLYGLKALKDKNIYDGDFNFGNILLQLDEEGHILKAGFTDFEEAEVLTPITKKEFRDPLIPDYEIQTQVFNAIAVFYSKAQLPVPEALKFGVYKREGVTTNVDTLLGKDYFIKANATYRDCLSHGRSQEEAQHEYAQVLQQFRNVRVVPTKTLEEIIAEVEELYAS